MPFIQSIFDSEQIKHQDPALPEGPRVSQRVGDADTQLSRNVRRRTESEAEFIHGLDCNCRVNMEHFWLQGHHHCYQPVAAPQQDEPPDGV